MKPNSTKQIKRTRTPIHRTLKIQILRALARKEMSLSEACAKHNLTKDQPYKWKKVFEAQGVDIFANAAKPATYQTPEGALMPRPASNPVFDGTDPRDQFIAFLLAEVGRLKGLLSGKTRASDHVLNGQ